MIFVTVGTHEQAFNRLIQKVDELKRDGIIAEDVFIQSGYSTYEPKYCQWEKLIPYSEMIKKVRKAKIVITHGGPASFIMPLQEGKIPVVVPRQLEFDEHINNHQVEFTEFIAERLKNILPVYDIDELGNVLANYENTIHSMDNGMISNNKKFNEELKKLLEK